LQKFLIIQTAFIGDVVLATPLIEKIHAFFPDAQIDFLLRKGNETLLQGHPYLHRLLIWDKKKNKQRNLFQILKEIRKIKYDKVINVQRFFATGLLTSLSAASETIGFNKNPLSFLFTKKIKHEVGGEKSIHETARNLLLIEAFTDGQMNRPKLYPTTQDFAFIKPFCSGKFITVSPASVWYTKQYPASQWISFLQQLPETVSVFLLGGSGDKALCAEIKDACIKHNITILAGTLSFLQSAALMSQAEMNYVNDSAPMHFASAMNAPVTAVYCSTIPEFGFGPLSDNRHLIEVQEKLYCRPCGLHGFKACPEGHFRCALDIRSPQLIRTLPSGL
jgi:ADP-heptose:LPS heptosyltransferase